MEQNKTIKQRNYLYEVLIIIIAVAIDVIWWFILNSVYKAIFAGCLSYYLLAWSLRLFFQKHHRKGMACMRAKNHSDALTAFKQSLDFFEKHPLIDKYRFITMFSSSAISYRHMALNNIGICYLHMGEDNKALDFFKKLAEENSKFPHIYDTIEIVERHINEGTESPKT